jgi:DNA helicase-2/ATP-dependent DNA helicase PcrA
MLENCVGVLYQRDMNKEKKLNNEQKEAVEFGEGPLLIIAGAGTGKTTVITERIKHLISSGLASSSEILALTFTEKAAAEMEERVDRLMPYGYTDMWICTFHSFCDRILRESAIQLGYDSGFTLMTEAQSVQFVKNNLFEFDLNYFRPLGNPNKFIEGLLTHFSRLADENISFAEYIRWAEMLIEKNKKQSTEEKLEAEKWMELARAYKKYDELKTQNSYFDFSDLITKTLKLFTERKNVLTQYQKQFKYILVDEFQDTNYAQNELAVMLAGKHANITVCGDDDQSIYRFRGAAVSNIMQFRKIFPKAKVVVLAQNYRSTQEILDCAYQAIQFNNPDRLEVSEGIDKKLMAVNKNKGVIPVFIHEETAIDEASAVVREIINLKSRGFEWGEIAILVRANNHADNFIRELTRAGVPHQFLGPEKLYEKPEIVELISYLKFLNNVYDSASLVNVLSMKIFGIKSIDLAKIGAKAKRNNKSIFEVIQESELEVSDETTEKLENFNGMVEQHLEQKNKLLP